MKLVRYECQKLTGLKLLWALLALCLIGNIVFCVSAANKQAARMLPRDQAQIIFSAYEQNPEKVVADLEAYQAEQQRLRDLEMQMIMESIQNNTEFTGFDWPEPVDVYATDPAIHDGYLFEALKTALENSVQYDMVLDGVIATAQQNILRCQLMGNSESSFVYVVQTDTIARYSHLKEIVEPEVEYIRGWDVYFSYDRSNVFLLFAVILLCSMVFVYDRETRFFPLLRTTRRGRAAMAAAKYGATMLSVAVLVSVFTLSNLIVIGSIVGFSSLGNALQAIPALVLCPWKLSIWQGVLMFLGMQILVYAAFAAVLLLLSLFFTTYAPVYLCGFGLYGIHTLLYNIRYSSANVPAKYVNLIAATDPDTYFSRVLHLHSGGYMITFLPFILICCGAILAVTLLGTLIVYSYNVHLSARLMLPIRLKLRKLPEAIRAFFGRIGKRRGSIYSLHLLPAEVRKRFSGRVILTVLILALGIYIMNDALTPTRTEDDKLYEAYMEQLQGELTEEKLTYLREEENFIRTTLQNASMMEQKFRDGEIDFEEYMLFMEDYHYANSHEDAFAMVKVQADYLQQLEREKGIRGEMLYATGWNLYFNNGVSVVLIAALLFLLTGAFSDEYTSHASSGAFVGILRTTRHGRMRTMLQKLGSCAMIAALFSLGYAVIELIILAGSWSMPGLGVSLVSLPLFAEADGTASILSFLLFLIVMRILIAALLAVLVVCFSGIIRRTLAVLTTCFALIFLPTVLLQFNVAVPTTLITMDYLSVAPHLFLGMEKNLAGFDLGLPLLLWAAALALTLLMTLFCAKRYVGQTVFSANAKSVKNIPKSS